MLNKEYGRKGSVAKKIPPVMSFKELGAETN
jgi:hypothetical protein